MDVCQVGFSGIIQNMCTCQGMLLNEDKVWTYGPRNPGIA